MQARWTSEAAYPGTVYGASTNGWMEEPQFFHWFQGCFIKHVENLRKIKNCPEQGALLIYDGHASHISIRIIEIAISHNITLVKQPSRLTDRLQPLDKCVFGSFKTCWEKKEAVDSPKKYFLNCLARFGFKSCGIFPVDLTMFPKTDFNVVDLEAYEVLMQRNHPTKAGVVARTVPEISCSEDAVSDNQVVAQPFSTPAENMQLSNTLPDTASSDQAVMLEIPASTTTASTTTASTNLQTTINNSSIYLNPTPSTSSSSIDAIFFKTDKTQSMPSNSKKKSYSQVEARNLW